MKLLLIQKELDVYFLYLVIIFASRISENLAEAMYRSQEIKDSKFVIAIMDYKLFDYMDIIEKVNGILIPIGFERSLQSKKVEILRQKIYNTLNYDTALDMEESFLTAFEMWEDSVKIASEYSTESDWSEIKYESLAIHDLTISMTSGPAKLENSNYISRTIYIFEVVNNKVNQKYPPIGSYEYNDPTPFLSSDECNFGRKDVRYSYNDIIIVISSVIIAINAIFCLYIYYWIDCNKRYSIVKVSGYENLMLINTGFLILSFAPVLFIIPPDNDFYCNLRIVYIILAFIPICSPMSDLCMKYCRIYMKTRAAPVNVNHILIISFAIEIIYLLIWFLQTPSTYIILYIIVLLRIILQNIQHSLKIHILLNVKCQLL